MSVIDRLKQNLIDLGYTDLSLNDQLYNYLTAQGFDQETLQEKIVAFGGWNALLVESLSSFDAPHTLFAEANDFETISMTWEWDGDEMDIDGFRIERQVNGTGPFELLIEVGAAERSYVDEGLTPDTLYAYRLRAYQGSGVSALSNVSADSTGELQIPSNLTATTLSSYEIEIEWDDTSPYETGVVVERRIGVGAWGEIASLPANSTSHIDDTVEPATTYEYRAYAVYGDWESDFSNTDAATSSGVGLDNWAQYGVATASGTGYDGVVANSDATKILGISSTGPLRRSVNSGGSWAAPATPPAGASVTYNTRPTVAYDTEDIYIGVDGTDGPRTMKSTDFGSVWNIAKSWTNGTGVPDVRVSRTGNIVFSWRSNYYSISSNSGASWGTETNTNTIVDCTMSADGSIIYYLGSGQSSINKSVNSGSSFSTVSLPQSATSSSTICCSADGQTLYYLRQQSGVATLYKSVNGGTNWSTVTPSGDYSLATARPLKLVCSSDGNMLLSSGQLTSDGHYTGLSTDGGTSFFGVDDADVQFRLSSYLYLNPDKGFAIAFNYPGAGPANGTAFISPV